MKKYKNKEDIIINTKNTLYNTGGGDCWFNTVFLALYKDEEYHLTIRKKISQSLVAKKAYFEEGRLTVNPNNQIIQISDYIEQIKFANQWSGDVEISETSKIYNNNLLFFDYGITIDSQITTKNEENKESA